MTKAFAIVALTFVSAASLLPGPAAAAGTTQDVSIAFKYNADASAEDNYRELRELVRRACSADQYLVSPVYNRKVNQDCRATLLNKAVAASQNPTLIALHGEPGSRSLAANATR